MTSISAPRLRLSERARSLTLPRPELAGLLLLAAILNLWALDQNGWANDYYSAAVRSMSEGWHNFFFGSFDSSGVMTVDKPPMALWVQALSVKVFGFHSLAILVPQALMGMGSVALVYDAARRVFERSAGFAAGLVLATTPITVAVSRHNNPDALLVLCSVAAIWFIVRALEDGRTRWLVWSGVMIGLGFETKMAAALIILPALAAAYLYVAPRGRLVAIRQLLAGGGALAVTAMAWPVAVWLTPAANRPWISGTEDNSIWSLIFGYNGVGRVAGQQGGPGGGGPGGGGGVFGGDVGPLRLLNEALGGQAGWLLGFAAVSGIAILVSSRLRRTDPRTGWVIAVGGAFATTAVVFSYASGIFHPYYVSLLAPFTALLVGGGVAVMLNSDVPARVFAPLAIGAGLLVEVAILDDNPGSLEWLPAVLIAGCVAAAVASALLTEKRFRAIAVSAGLGLLLIAPTAWSADTLGYATSSTFPAGGPQGSGGGMTGGGMGAPGGGPGGGRGGFAQRGGPGGGFGNNGGAPPAPPAGGFAPGGNGGLGGGMPGGMAGGGMGAPGGRSQQITSALEYIQQNGGGTLAVSSQNGGASNAIIESGADVVAIGGFSGRESQVSIEWLANEVRDGTISWVLADSGGMGGMADGRTGSSDVMAAVAETCTETTTSGLYDCRGEADALAALTQ